MASSPPTWWSIRQESRWTRLFMGNIYRAWNNLKGLSSDKRDSADQQQKQRAENGASSSKIMTNQLQAI